MDAGVPERTEILGQNIALDEEVRRTVHIEVPEAILALVEGCLDSHREAIGARLGRRLGEREGVSLLRYDTGGFYRPHVDRAHGTAWPEAGLREVTVVLFLVSSRAVDPAGEFTGGVLRLWPEGAEPVDIVSRRGMLVAFAADVPHEVTPVTSGQRDTAIDWFS